MSTPNTQPNRGAPPPFKYTDAPEQKLGFVQETLRGVMQSGSRLFMIGALFLVASSVAVALGLKVPYLGLLAELSMHMYVGMLCAFLIFVIASFLYQRKNPGDPIIRQAIRNIAFAAIASMASHAAVTYTAVPKLALAPVADKHQFAVASLNVHTDNMDMTTAAQWALENAPDVMAFVETSQAQAAALKKALGHRYEFEYLSKTEGPFGIAVYSVYPIQDPVFAYDTQADQPFFTGTVMFPARPLEIGVVHPMPPFTPEFLEKRDARVMEIVRKFEGKPSIIMGDFNATPGSTLFHEIGTKRYGSAPVKTFATVMPYALPVDHVLLAQHPQLALAESGSSYVEGSDHRLVWAAFHMDRAPAK